MIKQLAAPTTLSEAIHYFANKDRAFAFVVQLRWPVGVACQHCGAATPMLLKTRMIWKCRECRKQFSIKTGTIFEDSPLGLDKWLPAIWMLANSKNGISSYELGRSLGVTQKTAWFMLGRIRLAMQTGSFKKTRGIVEIDEAFFGGKAKNMHREKRERVLRGRTTGTTGKSAVIAGIVRGKGAKKSRAYAKVMRSLYAHPQGKIARDTVLPGSKVYTDSATLFDGSLDGFIRETVNHSEREYVRGEVHTNGVENFWSLLKRSIKGTYVAVDPFHLFRYVDEQVFRFNERGGRDKDRFVKVLADLIGRRLTYAELTGANLDPATT